MRKPLLPLDYPDIDIIRVEDTYYMVSTTMYFLPGCELLKSKDLLHWEHASFVYDRLDDTPAQKLENGENIYGKGMWAATLRYHKGTYYIMFVCNDTHKTYLYRAEKPEGPWRKSEVEGFYHDCSLLFDEDRIFLSYGNRKVYITELNEELTGPKEGGLHVLAVEDAPECALGYEGSHFYKIGGKYYLFLIHSTPGKWMRAEGAFVADKVEGPYVGGDIFINDIGYCGMGVAQGGIVDTPDGDYYSVMFQDRGAVGRIPILVAVSFDENGIPSMEGPETLVNDQPEVKLPASGPSVKGVLAGSDDFRSADGPSFGLKSFWQVSHTPILSGISLNPENGTCSLISCRTDESILSAPNTLTQRLYFPGADAEVTLDASALNEGDTAGLAIMQSAFAYLGVTKRDGKLYLDLCERDPSTLGRGFDQGELKELLTASVPLTEPVIRLGFSADFLYMKDEATFYYYRENEKISIGGIHKMMFRLDHFTGNRAALFLLSKQETGGKAVFSDFVMIPHEEK